MKIGDVVLYAGREYRIVAVRLGGIAGPHYRLAPLGDYPGEGLTSYRLLTAKE